MCHFILTFVCRILKICVCEHCVCTYACASAYTCVHGNQRGGPGVSQSIAVHMILLRKGISLNLGQRVGSQQAPVIHLSLPIPHSARVISAMVICFYWVAGIQTQVLALGQQEVLPTEPSLQPPYNFHLTFQRTEFLHLNSFN